MNNDMRSKKENEKPISFVNKMQKKKHNSKSIHQINLPWPRIT